MLVYQVLAHGSDCDGMESSDRPISFKDYMNALICECSMSLSSDGIGYSVSIANVSEDTLCSDEIWNAQDIDDEATKLVLNSLNLTIS